MSSPNHTFKFSESTMMESLFQDSHYDVGSGARHYPGYLNPDRQSALLSDIRAVVTQAPLYRPAMPRSGKLFSVQMTNCGSLGWVSDKTNGYRYQATHPMTGRAWPPIPDALLDIWADLAPGSPEPEAALINFYEPDARLGLHRDEDEEDFNVPVISLSLGDEARFRIGGSERRDKTRSLRLLSGDAFVLAGPARLAYHGIDKVFAGTSQLLASGGRINITMRRVTKPL